MHGERCAVPGKPFGGGVDQIVFIGDRAGVAHGVVGITPGPVLAVHVLVVPKSQRGAEGIVERGMAGDVTGDPLAGGSALHRQAAPLGQFVDVGVVAVGVWGLKDGDGRAVEHR